MKQYLQCRLNRGESETIAWIEKRGAKEGAAVELLPSKEVWHVTEVFGFTMPEDMLKDLKKMHRNSLPSIKGMQ